MKADDRRVTTVFTVQLSFHHRHSTNPSIMKRYHRRRTTRWVVTARSPTMVALHEAQFVKCRWWNDGWTVKTVITWRSSASMIPAPGAETQPTSPRTDTIAPSNWQGSQYRTNFKVTGMTWPGRASAALETDVLSLGLLLLLHSQLYFSSALFWVRFLHMWPFLFFLIQP